MRSDEPNHADPAPGDAEDHDGHEHDGHDHDDHAAMFRQKVLISALLTVPAVIYSSMLQDLLGYTAPEFPGSNWVAAVFATAVFAYGGPVFLRGGVSEIKARQPGMMLLISLGLIVSFVASVASQFGLIDVDLWFELATLVTVMLVGHWLEMRAVGRAQGALAALAELLPDDAERLDADGEPTTVAIAELAEDDIVLVRAGGRVPADGTITEGEAELDESMITGESRPVAKKVDDPVVAGTVSTDSSIRIRVSATGDDTALAGIQRLVEEAQGSRPRAQAMADRFAGWLFYAAVASGLITFVVWMALGEPANAVERTVTVLVIVCPHALGLAIPLTIAVSTSVAASSGILIKDRLALEGMRRVDVVLFDKTGTLTAGEHEVTDLAVAGVDEHRLLTLASAVEAESEHPLARAIIARAGQDDAVGRGSDHRSLAGRGVTATVDGVETAVGGPALLEDRGVEVPEALAETTEQWRERGASVLHVIADGEVVGAFAMEDAIRPESADAVRALADVGIQTAMITGDAQQVADSVADALGIDEVFAEVLPEDKDSKVTELQGRGRRVAMVGDGVNDAPALARADVGIAIGAGTDVAMESAGVVLASSDPRSVLGVLKLSKASYTKMIQNLAWGAGYNLIAIPLAAGVLAFAGITLSPAVGAIIMSASTVIVAANAQLLRRVDLDRDRLCGQG